MAEIKTICPEKDCGAATSAWANGLMSKEQWGYERACPKHREKYLKLRDEAERDLEFFRRICR